ncbi:MAG: YceI family protein [bacterium]|nr:YceI family protein [Candidatus Kapabacteria bacterium]
MRAQRLFILAGIIAIGATIAADAQPLKVAARGAKRVTLSDRVGKNQFTWNSDAPLEKIKGSSEGVTGSFSLDPANLATMRGTISTKVSTMKSGSDQRDGHLKGDQWLDAAKYPTITFTITSITGVKVTKNKAKGTAKGNFTMHGVTKQISIPFTLTYLDASTATAKRAPGDLVMLNADFTIALKDFKVAGTKGLVGSKVGEKIKVKAQLFGTTSS